MVIFVLGGVAGGVLVDHNETHNPTKNSEAGRTRVLLAGLAQVKTEQDLLMQRVRQRDGLQNAFQVRRGAYQNLSRAGQTRVDAYAPVVFRLSGITVDGRTLAISMSAHPARLRQSALMPIWLAGEINDAALKAAATNATNVATPPVSRVIGRLTDDVVTAEATFADLAHQADSYSIGTYAAAVKRWVGQQQAVALAFTAFRNSTG